MLLGLFIIAYGIDGDAGFSPSLMFQNVIRRSINSNLTNSTEPDNSTGNTTPFAVPVVAAPDSSTHDEVRNKSIFVLSILVSFCVFAVLGVAMTVVCWIRISNTKKPKDVEFKAKGAENLDKQNMRDVQLSEYEKRKRQMKELDSQQEEPPDGDAEESDDGGELDEITAVQSQPLEEETIVNPNFIHHYIPRQSSRVRGSMRGN